MDKRRLNSVEVDGKTYFYLDFGSETHGRTSFRLWVNRRFVQFESDKADDEDEGIIIPTLTFPVNGAMLVEGTKQRTVILRKGEGIVYRVYVPEGYRGRGEVTKWDPLPKRIFVYKQYRSPLGSCGIGTGYLIESLSSKVTYHWHRNGRLYGNASDGITIIYADGRVETADNIAKEDLEELE